MKKEFTDERPLRLSKVSDIELIERLNTGTIGTGERDVIKSILDIRHKKVIQRQTEVIKVSNKASEKYNKQLLKYTITIAFLTLLMLAGLIIQILIV
jgi:hypothetical protein